MARDGDGALDVALHLGLIRRFMPNGRLNAGLGLLPGNYLAGLLRANSDPEIVMNTNGRFGVFAVVWSRCGTVPSYPIINREFNARYE